MAVGRKCVALGLLAVIALSVWSCAAQPQGPAAAATVVAQEWTNRPVLDGAERFHFAILADVTGGRRPGVLEAALRKLDLMQPAFVMCVGDLTEGYTEDPAQIRQQRGTLGEELGALPMRFYYLAGNHDISNPAMAAEWKERYGSPYYHFLYRNVLFLCLDTEDPPATHISPEQVAYVRQALAENADVRWTFVFMHKPMWLEQQGNEPGWQAIAQVLASRPYTAFAGHVHQYVYSVRDGRDHIALATSGGASQLRGPALGEFDEIAWVTMTEQGPVIANLELSGILPKDVVSEEADSVNSALLNAAYVHAPAIVAGEQLFRQAAGKLVFENKQPYALKIAVSFAEGGQLRVEPGTFDLELQPGESREAPFTVTAAKPTDLVDLQPLGVRLSATYRMPGREAVTVPATSRIDIRGSGEGPELVRNGGFDGAGDPWFVWAHTPETGEVSISDGELKATLKQPPDWWSAGFGQNVARLRAGGTYRLTFRAAGSGGAGRLHLQIAVEGKDMPAAVLINGQSVQELPIPVSQTMERHTVEFTVPRDGDLADGKPCLCLGDLRQARIDDVSLREVGSSPSAR